MTLNGVMALFCVISANSGSLRAHCVKVHVRYLISWWVLVGWLGSKHLSSGEWFDTVAWVTWRSLMPCPHMNLFILAIWTGERPLSGDSVGNDEFCLLLAVVSVLVSVWIYFCLCAFRVSFVPYLVIVAWLLLRLQLSASKDTASEWTFVCGVWH